MTILTTEHQKKEVIRRNYTVEKRIFLDAFSLKGWFRNMKPDWSDWEPMYSYTVVENAGSMYKTLMKNKPYQKMKVEYRFIKEPVQE